jgi:hypothetical protein
VGPRSSVCTNSAGRIIFFKIARAKIGKISFDMFYFLILMHCHRVAKPVLFLIQYLCLLIIQLSLRCCKALHYQIDKKNSDEKNSLFLNSPVHQTGLNNGEYAGWLD